MQGAVGALGQRFLDGLRHARRTERADDHFAGVLFLQPQSFFKRENVRLVDLEAHVLGVNPGARGVQLEHRFARRNLFEADDDFHGRRSPGEIAAPNGAAPGIYPACVMGQGGATRYPPNFLKSKDAFVPPNPKEFESAYSTAAGRA